MTAHAMKGDRERCLAAGMDGYVSKPIQDEELTRAIEECVPETGSIEVAARRAARAGRGRRPRRRPGPRRRRSGVPGRDDGDVPGRLPPPDGGHPRGHRPGRRAQVRAVTHTLKNWVGNFVAPSAFEATRAMEEMGHAGRPRRRRRRLCDVGAGDRAAQARAGAVRPGAGSMSGEARMPQGRDAHPLRGTNSCIPSK